MYFQWSKVKKKIFFEVGVFKQGDVLKQMVQKGYKISFRMYLNLCNSKFSRIDVEKRVYKEVILSLHFSIASFNMHSLYQIKHCLSLMLYSQYSTRSSALSSTHICTTFTLRSKGKASTYILYCTDHSAYISLTFQNQCNIYLFIYLFIQLYTVCTL